MEGTLLTTATMRYDCHDTAQGRRVPGRRPRSRLMTEQLVHPRSTTSGSPCADLDEAIAFYERRVRHALRARGDQRGAGRPRGDDGVGDSGSCVQLLAPLRPDSTIGKFLDRSGPGHPADGLPRRRHRRGRAHACARAGVRLLYDEPRRGTAGSRVNFVHPKDCRRRPRRARRASPRLTATEPASLSGSEPETTRAVGATGSLTTVTIGGRRAADPRRDPRRRPPGRGLRRARRPRVLPRASPSTRTRSDMFDGAAHAGEGPAQVPAPRRGALPRSSAPARRWSR